MRNECIIKAMSTSVAFSTCLSPSRSVTLKPEKGLCAKCGREGLTLNKPGMSVLTYHHHRPVSILCLSALYDRLESHKRPNGGLIGMLVSTPTVSHYSADPHPKQRVSLPIQNHGKDFVSPRRIKAEPTFYLPPTNGLNQHPNRICQ